MRRTLKKNIDMMQEVLTIATEIARAWNEALKKEPKPVQKAFMQKAAAYEKFVTTYEQ